MSTSSVILVFGKKNIGNNFENYEVKYTSSYKKYLKDEEENLIDGDIIINQIYKDQLSLRLDNPEIPFEVKIINYSNKIKNEEALEDLIEKQKHDDYNVLYFTERYKGKKNETMDKFYTDMYIIVDQMIRAGYLEYKNYNKVDDWILTFQEPCMKLFVEYYKPELSNEFSTYEIEFLSNPQFRHLILISFMKILANHLVLNKKFKKDVDWTNPSVWIDIGEFFL